jgi:hypothetical protein
VTRLAQRLGEGTEVIVGIRAVCGRKGQEGTTHSVGEVPRSILVLVTCDGSK